MALLKMKMLIYYIRSTVLTMMGQTDCKIKGSNGRNSLENSNAAPTVAEERPTNWGPGALNGILDGTAECRQIDRDQLEERPN